MSMQIRRPDTAAETAEHRALSLALRQALEYDFSAATGRVEAANEKLRAFELAMAEKRAAYEGMTVAQFYAARGGKMRKAEWARFQRAADKARAA